MRRRKAFAVMLCALFFTSTVFASSPPEIEETMGLILSEPTQTSLQGAGNAQAAVLIEASTCKVLYDKTAHKKLPMASTTKIMTAILAIENKNLNELFTIPKEAYGAEGSSMYLRLAEKVSVKDLLFGLMLSSGNDAAIALAIAVGGSVQNFAEMMNTKAKSIGAFNTNFVTPNGLHDDNHYTTAYDLALIASYAMKNDTFREIVSSKYHRTTTGDVVRTLKNKNKLLTSFEGASGIKTGYTQKAGKCLVFSAMRDNMEVIGVVLNCYDMFPTAMRLMEDGFSNYEMQPVVNKGDTIAYVRVENGRKKNLALLANEDIMVAVKTGESVAVRTVVKLNEGIAAPITKGTALGWLEVWEDGRMQKAVAIVAAESVAINRFTDYIEKLFLNWAA